MLPRYFVIGNLSTNRGLHPWFQIDWDADAWLYLGTDSNNLYWTILGSNGSIWRQWSICDIYYPLSPSSAKVPAGLLFMWRSQNQRNRRGHAKDVNLAGCFWFGWTPDCCKASAWEVSTTSAGATAGLVWVSIYAPKGTEEAEWTQNLLLVDGIYRHSTGITALFLPGNQSWISNISRRNYCGFNL